MHGTRFSWKKIYFDIRCALQKFILCFFLFSFFVFFVSNTTKTRQIAFYERHVIRSNSKENNNGNVKVVYYISLEFQCCEFLWHPTTLAHVSSYFFFLFFFFLSRDHLSLSAWRNYPSNKRRVFPSWFEKFNRIHFHCFSNFTQMCVDSSNR